MNIKAWANEHDHTRVISDAQKQQALRDGGASASAVEGYSIPLEVAADSKPAIAAIQFALETTEGLEFLRAWLHGDWDTIRNEWPNASSAVFVGLMPTEATLRAKFQSLNTDSYNFRRSTRGNYTNQVISHDWKWFQLGAKAAAE